MFIQVNNLYHDDDDNGNSNDDLLSALYLFNTMLTALPIYSHDHSHCLEGKEEGCGWFLISTTFIQLGKGRQLHLLSPLSVPGTVLSALHELYPFKPPCSLAK